MQTNIITLGQINAALHIATVNVAQLAEMGFSALDNKEICESLPKDQAKPLWRAALYPAAALPLIRGKLAALLGQQLSAAPGGPAFERKRANK